MHEFSAARLPLPHQLPRILITRLHSHQNAVPPWRGRPSTPGTATPRMAGCQQSTRHLASGRACVECDQYVALTPNAAVSHPLGEGQAEKPWVVTSSRQWRDHCRTWTESAMIRLAIQPSNWLRQMRHVNLRCRNALFLQAVPPQWLPSIIGATIPNCGIEAGSDLRSTASGKISPQ
ncbi:MAG: hypothetical protein QOI59_3106 [Gammaproteobacteria bacterium]|jgi:hypothetical protein|nr:hypothetical protein [Gammaproteobacteria bacterium]